MNRYSNYIKDKSRDDLTQEEMLNIKWPEYKIVVPTEDAKNEIIEALKEFHDSDFDSDIIACNSLAHQYNDGEDVGLEVAII